MVNEVLFWTVAVLTVLPALALLFARKTVHIAMAVVLVMVGLAVAYVALDAPFLGVVQIVVYTGAVMMLFVFVLMLVGVDTRESIKEQIKGQRWVAFFLGAGLILLFATVLSRITFYTAEVGAKSEPADLALTLFKEYVIVMEALAFVLISAAVGALMLTYIPRLTPRRTQKTVHEQRLLAGADPVNKPMPGVYARHNALDTPALDPDGDPIEDSVSRVLEVRHQNRDGDEFIGDVQQVRRELGLAEDQEEQL